MGTVSSRPDDNPALYLRDPYRVSLANIAILYPRKRTSINIVPNGFPPARLSASRQPADMAPVEFVQDTETSSASGGPSFLLKLTNDDEIVVNFSFVIRQTQQIATTATAAGSDAIAMVDTQINRLTYVHASTPKEVETLLTREFHADPNLHKNANVRLVGNYSTDGCSSVTFDWSWKWKPPKISEDRTRGWRNTCSFVEYDQRIHALHTLASFSFYVANVSPGPMLPSSYPSSPSPGDSFLVSPLPKIRVASSQSIDSRATTTDADDPASPSVSAPTLASNSAPSPAPSASVQEPVKVVDVSCSRPGEDLAVSDDGPVFRATIKALEQKTGNMRMQMKKVIKKAEQACTAQIEANDAFMAFTDALKETSSTNANAVQPAIDHYFNKIAREILNYEKFNAWNLQRYIIDPLNKLYTVDIKQAEAKKRDFEEESRDYYAYVSRYLGQRQDSVKTKLAESDTKYHTKRRNFELKRFDYSSFMQDLSGGRKEQEVLSHLTRFADEQTQCFLRTAKKIDALLPQLTALTAEVQEVDKEYQYQRREREEKRRLLEKNKSSLSCYVDADPGAAATTAPLPPTASQGSASNGHNSESEMARGDSIAFQLAPPAVISSGTHDLSRSLGGGVSPHPLVGSPSQNPKFKGIRDLEERNPFQALASDRNGMQQRKEGLLWALNRPGGHVDPRNLNKQGWHKFWIVLDQGKLSEYSNWKQKLDLHMDPIDLRMASVREARNAERRFCFEVITPQFKRVYQATSEDDMNSWITAINNALQSAVEGRAFKGQHKPTTTSPHDATFRKDIGSILTGKSPSVGHNNHHNREAASAAAANASAGPVRRTTVAGKPSLSRSGSSMDDKLDRLLETLRKNDQGNTWCVDCGSTSKVEWVSINLGVILCIECSGIHRSLGTHISKVRSLTLDITSFTPSILELLLLVGNRVANMIWEAKLDPALKPSSTTTREQRLKFITAKYVQRAFVEPISPMLSRYSSPEETLIAAIKKNEIQQVIYGLALKASPNTVDRSRGTHALYLALAAADPAAPSPVTTPGLTSSTPTPKAVTFPVAELLIQNGAYIPDTPPAFPLSRAARNYLDIKRGRAAPAISSSSEAPGTTMTTTTMTSSFTTATTNTTTTTNASMMTPGVMSPGEKQRDKESRLQKRIIAGGRLAKMTIPER